MYERLEGKHIRLRKAREDDWQSMLAHVWSDEAVYRWMLFQPTFTEEEARGRARRSAAFQQDHFAWFIALADTDEAIGYCGMKEVEPGHFEESGICLGTAWHGRGFGTEAVGLMLDLAFLHLGAKDFRYSYFRDNEASKALAEHFGFAYDHSYEITRPWDGTTFTSDSCLLTRTEYLAQMVKPMERGTQMQREKSCGAVVYRRTGAGTLFLLERMVLGHTSLPKGHVEGAETEEETARREIREETGLEVELCTAFRRQITYAPRPGVTKDVVFFLAEALPGEAVNQECEVAGIEWLPYEEALTALTYDSDRDVLTEAMEWLTQTDEGCETSGKPGERTSGAVRLEEVTPENWRADLRVREDQQRFVASREGTLARAFAYRERRSQAFIVMAGEEPVGMAMYYDSPQSKAYFFSEFFIDERYQGRGYGRAAAQLVLERMRADGRYARVLLCYVEGNDAAKRLYESLGFHCTGEADGDEIVMELNLNDAKAAVRDARLSKRPAE